jgi:hypothetical protein
MLYGKFFFWHASMHAGPKFQIWFGTMPRLTISELELIREVLLSQAEHFELDVALPLIRQFKGMGASPTSTTTSNGRSTTNAWTERGDGGEAHWQRLLGGGGGKD